MLHVPNRSILPLSGIDRRLVGCVMDSVWRTNGTSVTQRLWCSWMCAGMEFPMYPLQYYLVLLILCIQSQMIYLSWHKTYERQITIEKLFYFHLHKILILFCGSVKGEFYIILFYYFTIILSPVDLIQDKEVLVTDLVPLNTCSHCPLGCLW